MAESCRGLEGGYSTNKRGWKCWGVMVGNVSDLKENGWVEYVSFLYRNERMCMFRLLADLYSKRYENNQERKNRG